MDGEQEKKVGWMESRRGESLRDVVDAVYCRPLRAVYLDPCILNYCRPL